jgi:hypothetical protein
MDPEATRCIRDSVRFIETVEELLDRGHPVRFRAEGWSMHPSIRNGETIIVAPLGRSPIRIGDVVLYKQGSVALAHRVVQVQPSLDRVEELVLRGDGADCCDAPISLDHVLGRVVSIERGGHMVRPNCAVSGWSRLVRRALRRARAAGLQIAALLGTQL